MSFFSSPIGRLAFLGRHILGFIIVMIGRMGFGMAAQNENWFFIILSEVVMLVGIFYYINFSIFPRLASIGLSRWCILVSLVPVVNFVFLLFMFFCPAGWLVKYDKVA